MLTIYRAEKKDINSITKLIYKLNNQKKSNIGFCGKDKYEIKKCLEEYFEEEPESSPFFLYKEDGKIVGMLGYDGDIKSGVAELWGPFIDIENYEKWEIISYNLWNELMDYEINIISYNMFINVNNKNCINFAYDRGFSLINEEFVLKLYKKDFKYNIDYKINESRKNDHEKIIALHDNIFKNTYYTGKQIIDRINDNRKVFTMVENEEPVGYVYVEVYPEFGDASIEFLGVDENKRGQGLGKKLMNKAVNWIFSFDEINEVKLCVNSANKALKLYQDIGFQVVDELIFLKL